MLNNLVWVSVNSSPLFISWCLLDNWWWILKNSLFSRLSKIECEPAQWESAEGNVEKIRLKVFFLSNGFYEMWVVTPQSPTVSLCMMWTPSCSLLYRVSVWGWIKYQLLRSLLAAVYKLGGVNIPVSLG